MNTNITKKPQVGTWGVTAALSLAVLVAASPAKAASDEYGSSKSLRSAANLPVDGEMIGASIPTDYLAPRLSSDYNYSKLLSFCQWMLPVAQILCQLADEFPSSYDFSDPVATMRRSAGEARLASVLAQLASMRLYDAAEFQSDADLSRRAQQFYSLPRRYLVVACAAMSMSHLTEHDLAIVLGKSRHTVVNYLKAAYRILGVDTRLHMFHLYSPFLKSAFVPS